MKPARVEPVLHALRAAAEELAKRAKEHVSTAHLLAAVAQQNSPASELLSERRLSAEEILRLGRAHCDELPEPVRTSLQRAHEIAVRMGFTQASAAHLLVALLNEPRSAARRLLEQSGADVMRLRTSAMQLGLGLLRGRRTLSRPPLAAPPTAPAPARQRSESAPSPALATQVEPAPRRVRTAVSVPTVPRVAALKAPSAASEVSASPSARLDAEPPRPKPNSEPGVPRPRTAPPPPKPQDTSRFELDPQKFPMLCSVGKNLTLAAARGELDPVVGRDQAIEQVLDVLAKRHGNNPCLIGAAGVGKTSVVRGLAQRIAEAHDIESLDDKILIEVPISELLAGTGVRGALAGRMGAIRREVQLAAGRVVLFFDEMQQLFSSEAEELAAELKLALGRGELPCIGATTHEDFQKRVSADPALARHLCAVEVEEPAREEAFLILEALRPKLEAHHRVRYEPDALALAVAWSVRYLPGRALPEKAVSILDLAGARSRRRGKPEIAVDTVAEIVAELCDMPVERLLESDGDRLLRLEQLLAERVVGHSSKLQRISRILRRNAAGLGSRRPIGTFLLLGPSGVGKTETAKAIAEVLFHCDSALTRIDLSEYSEAHAVARLIGAPPGYVGHEAGGQLTEAVRKRPYQVILLDELEKAHPDVLTSFLGVFDEGRLTDGRGRTVDFTNTVILMTSNIGSGEVSANRRRVGFGEAGEAQSDLDSRIEAAARARLAPELYNRIDEVLVYAPLAQAEVRQIAERLLRTLAATLLRERGARLEFTSDVIDFLLERGGYDLALGARPMKRTIARLIEAPLAEKVLAGELARDSVLLIGRQGDELDFDVLDAGAFNAAE